MDFNAQIYLFRKKNNEIHDQERKTLFLVLYISKLNWRKKNISVSFRMQLLGTFFVPSPERKRKQIWNTVQFRWMFCQFEFCAVQTADFFALWKQRPCFVLFSVWPVSEKKKKKKTIRITRVPLYHVFRRKLSAKKIQKPSASHVFGFSTHSKKQHRKSFYTLGHNCFRFEAARLKAGEA